MRLKNKAPQTFDKAITHLKKELNNDTRVTKTKALGIIRVAKGLPEKIPSIENRTTVHLGNEIIEEIEKLLPITGFPSLRSFTMAAINSFIAVQKNAYRIK